MENQTNKLERFKQAVFDDAEKQAKLITEAADKQRETELAQAKIEAQSLADSKKAAADKNEEARAVRGISSKQLEAKRNVLCHREKLIDSVFDSVKNRLAAFKASGEYKLWLKEKAEKCKQTYPEHKGVLYLSPEDMTFAPELAGFEVKSRDSIELGGVLAVYDDMGIALDYTFDSAFEQQRSAFTEKAELVLG